MARKSRKKHDFSDVRQAVLELSHDFSVCDLEELAHQSHQVNLAITDALSEKASLKDAIIAVDDAMNAIIRESQALKDASLSAQSKDSSVFNSLAPTNNIIAIIDDEKSIGMATQSILNEFNAYSTYFSSIDAFKKSVDFSDPNTLPHTILLDIVMPYKTVEDVFKFAREMVERGITVISCSSTFTLETRLAAVRAGVSDYVVKPVSPYSLIEKIHRANKAKRPDTFDIVLVDDQESMGVFYKSLFERHNCKVTYISSAEKLLESLDYLNPDLFLLDMFMPNINGLELAGMLRQEEKFDFAPIVFLTADDRLDTKLKVLTSGADDVIDKSTPAHLVAQQVLARLHRSSAIRRFVSKDALTGALNHGQIVDSLTNVMRLASRNQTHNVMAIIDVDHFKNINDTHGHSQGDKVLSTLGQQLMSTFRESDHIGRYGGEEFLIIIRECKLTVAVQKLNELRESFSNMKFRNGSDVFTVSFSGGVVSLDDYNEARDAINKADELLYEAKDSGRNCIKF